MKKNILILAMLVMMFAGIAFAATNFTNALGDNDFNNAGNWDNDLPGSVGGDPTINDTAVVTADYLKGTTGAFITYIGSSATGELIIPSGVTLETGNHVRVGDGAGGYGTLDVFGYIKIAGTNKTLHIGTNGGEGYVNVMAGGELNTAKRINIVNGKLTFDAAAVSTPDLKDWLTVDADGILAFKTDGATVATIYCSTVNVELFEGSTLELALGGLFDIGDSWILVSGVSSFGQQGTFSNVVSGDGYTIAIDYTTATLTATLTGAVALPVAPAVTETDVVVTSPLTWKAGNLTGTVTGYDVYIDTDPCMSTASPLVENEDVLTTSTTLLNDTTYYWRVDAYEDQGGAEPNLVPGSVWSFTTIAAEPKVTSGPEAFTLVDGIADVTLTITSEYADTYLWYKDDVALSDIAGKISGSDSQSLTVIAPDKADEGYYYCIASDSATPGIDAQSPSGQIMTKRLVAHWDFEDSLTDSESGLVGSYVDVDGAPLEESSLYTDLGEGNVSGKCISLASDTNHIRIASADEFFANCPIGFTASAFVQVDPGREYATMLAYQNTAQNEGWRLRCYNTKPDLVVNQATDDDADAVDNISTAQWHMITGTFDGQYLTIYVDGVAAEVSEQNLNTIDYSGDAIIGAGKTNGSGYFYGLLDEVKYWNYPLDSDAVLQEYAQTLGHAVCSKPGALQYDLTDDCQVNIDDLLILVGSWLDTSNIVEPSN